MKRIVIDPITRIEGHLRIEIEVEGGVIRKARSSGALYRGLEQILVGRHPLDAQKITQRICGVCPVAHSTAASLCLDDALGLRERIPKNGSLLRNLICGANFLHNHILHFYHLALPDYLDPSALSGDRDLATLADFLSPGGEVYDRRFSQEENRMLFRHYAEALTMRRKAQELVALFGGKVPHDMAIVPGGVTYRPSLGDIEAFRFRLREVRSFIEECYFPDVLLFVKRCSDYFDLGRVGNLLSFGGFPLPKNSQGLGGRLFPAGILLAGRVESLDAEEITECITSSWYEGKEVQHPKDEQAVPKPGKAGAYSWIKAPRYRGEPYEVGPAARIAIGLHLGDEPLKSLANEGLREAGAALKDLSSVAGRHLSRAIEARYLALKMEEWLESLDPDGPVAVPFEIPEKGEGCGLTCAPRGALGHWIRIEEGRICHYQVVSPTTWNASPRDESGQPGPIEQALEGTRVQSDGLTEAGRIVRSFDPCLACAVQ